jgi:hypothetical protein
MSEETRRRLIDSIPEAAIVDSFKENVQPLRSGRNVAALTTLFETSPHEREREIQLGRAQFQEDLNSMEELDDPLEVYIRYISWTHRMFPQGGQSNESNLIGLLKDACDKFRHSKRYKSDARYLKIWIEYAKWVDEPKEIFKCLMELEIGQALALFYEEYAAYYERLEK